MRASTPHFVAVPFSPWPRRIPAFLVALLLAWFAPYGLAQDRQLAASNFVTVPNVTGMKLEQAKATLSALRIYVRRADDQLTSDASQAGRVAWQDKAAGQRVLAPTSIALRVYKLGAGINVPNVVGMTRDEARRALFARGLGYSDMLRDVPNASPAQAGRVATQQPAAGANLPRGGRVALQFYRAAATARVPAVVGMDRNAAADALHRAGFLVDRAEEPIGDPARFGKVLRQSPAAGASLPKGARVQIIVAAAGATIRVPSVVGMTSGNAFTALSRARLTGRTVSQTLAAPVAARAHTVARQEPAAGQQAVAGGTVQLWLYGAFDRRAQVPNLLLMTEADARRALAGVGLAVLVKREKTPVPSRWGKVMQQSPAARTVKFKGTTVTIIVGAR